VGLFLRFLIPSVVPFEVLRRASGPLLAMLAVGLFFSNRSPSLARAAVRFDLPVKNGKPFVLWRFLASFM
jgi:hypothetical protein